MEPLFDPGKTEWEYVIVGTGIGGATLGYRLAKAGKRVLFCEQGRACIPSSECLRGDYAEHFFETREWAKTKHKETLSRAGRWYSEISDLSGKKRKSFIPFIGAGTGGSSALYGGVMERFWPEDFEPGRWHKDARGSSIPWEWPVTYKEYEAYYEQAEQLYRVRGSADPLRMSGTTKYPDGPPPLSPANMELYEFLKSRGLHPYPLPTACEHVPGCQSCQGFLCAQGCKNDSAKVCLEPALKKHGARLMDRCEVRRIEARAGRAANLLAIWKGREVRIRGANIVLAAGALATPAILLRSRGEGSASALANESDMVGRNLMRHFVDLHVLLSGKKPALGDNPKEIGFNDYYASNGEKLGTVQSFGWLPPAPILVDSLEQDLLTGTVPVMAYLFKPLKPLVRAVLDRALCHRLVLASVLEDLPYPDNRVEPDGEAGIRFRYRTGAYDEQRIRRFRQVIKQSLNPWRQVLIKQAQNNDRLAHVSGTCRMGEDPESSVVDRLNRAHRVKNLYIIDSSFFPSSGGTNPSLTIAANALRVADHMLAL